MNRRKVIGIALSIGYALSILYQIFCLFMSAKYVVNNQASFCRDTNTPDSSYSQHEACVNCNQVWLRQNGHEVKTFSHHFQHRHEKAHNHSSKDNGIVKDHDAVEDNPASESWNYRKNFIIQTNQRGINYYCHAYGCYFHSRVSQNDSWNLTQFDKYRNNYTVYHLQSNDKQCKAYKNFTNDDKTYASNVVEQFTFRLKPDFVLSIDCFEESMKNNSVNHIVNERSNHKLMFTLKSKDARNKLTGTTDGQNGKTNHDQKVNDTSTFQNWQQNDKNVYYHSMSSGTDDDFKSKSEVDLSYQVSDHSSDGTHSEHHGEKHKDLSTQWLPTKRNDVMNPKERSILDVIRRVLGHHHAVDPLADENNSTSSGADGWIKTDNSNRLKKCVNGIVFPVVIFAIELLTFGCSLVTYRVIYNYFFRNRRRDCAYIMMCIMAVLALIGLTMIPWPDNDAHRFMKYWTFWVYMGCICYMLVAMGILASHQFYMHRTHLVIAYWDSSFESGSNGNTPSQAPDQSQRAPEYEEPVDGGLEPIRVIPEPAVDQRPSPEQIQQNPVVARTGHGNPMARPEEEERQGPKPTVLLSFQSSSADSTDTDHGVHEEERKRELLGSEEVTKYGTVPIGADAVNRSSTTSQGSSESPKMHFYSDPSVGSTSDSMEGCNGIPNGRESNAASPRIAAQQERAVSEEYLDAATSESTPLIRSLSPSKSL